MANTNPAHVVLTNVRLSYVSLLAAKVGQDGGEPKYSCMVLVPKMPADNRAKIDAAIRAATEKARAKFGDKFPMQPKISVHDGDGTRPSDGQPFGAECKGCWVFTASSKLRPEIVDADLQPIMDSTQIYSGMYANVGVTFFGYNAPQNKGIGVAIDTVMKTADGEPLGGVRASAEDDFTGMAQGVTTTAQPAAAYPGYPATPAAQPAPAAAYPVYPAQAAPMYTAPATYPPQPIDPITGLPLV